MIVKVQSPAQAAAAGSGSNGESGGMGTVGMVLIGLLLAGAAYLGWEYWQSRKKDENQQTNENDGTK